MLRSMITASDRYSGNDRYSGIKSPDRFFHYSGRCLYFYFLTFKCHDRCYGSASAQSVTGHQSERASLTGRGLFIQQPLQKEGRQTVPQFNRRNGRQSADEHAVDAVGIAQSQTAAATAFEGSHFWRQLGHGGQQRHGANRVAEKFHS